MAEIVNEPPPDGFRLDQDVVMLDDMEEVEEMNAKLEVKDDNSGHTNEDNNVESPTTGDNYVFKCVFCERVLNGSDAPKLLECLHNACGSCINNKLFEQNEGNAKGEFIYYIVIVDVCLSLAS